MPNDSLENASPQGVTVDAGEPGFAPEQEGREHVVENQRQLISSLRQQLARAESAVREADELRQKELSEASSRVAALGVLVDGRAKEVDRLQKDLADQTRQLSLLESNLRRAEREKDGALGKLAAFQESTTEIKRAYDARAAALEQANQSLVRTEADAVTRATAAENLSRLSREEVEKSQQALAQTFRDFHGLQTAHFTLQLESARLSGMAQADAKQAVELRRQLESQLQELRSEYDKLVQAQGGLSQELVRLRELVAVNHQAQVGRFDAAVSYLGSLLKSPLVRWSLRWRVRRTPKPPTAGENGPLRLP
ncbi:MAG TPA: hypothetical protein PLN52_23685 [Opitutaceae bacterium]|nr:hypothetical protein [Opitutaceae bacterium]